MSRQFSLTDTRDVHGKPVRVSGQAFPRTHASPAGLELDLTVGREAAAFDVVTPGGRAIVEDIIASLQAAIEMGLEMADAATVEVLDDVEGDDWESDVDEQDPDADVVVQVDFTPADDVGDDPEDDDPRAPLTLVR